MGSKVVSKSREQRLVQSRRSEGKELICIEDGKANKGTIAGAERVVNPGIILVNIFTIERR